MIYHFSKERLSNCRALSNVGSVYQYLNFEFELSYVYLPCTML